MKEKSQNAFVYLYPEVDILDFEVSNRPHFIKKGDKEKFLAKLRKEKSEKKKLDIVNQALAEMKKQFKLHYQSQLNACINLRYRQNGFNVFFALLDGSPISPLIDVKEQDRIIYVGIDKKTHRTQNPDGSYTYPDQNFILNQLDNPKVLRVGGFHMWDCVEKLAEKAHERGIDTLVDEDLTEFFASRITEKGFSLTTYPSTNPRKSDNPMYFEMFINARRNKPWLWQKY